MGPSDVPDAGSADRSNARPDRVSAAPQTIVPPPRADRTRAFCMQEAGPPLGDARQRGGPLRPGRREGRPARWGRQVPPIGRRARARRGLACGAMRIVPLPPPPAAAPIAPPLAPPGAMVIARDGRTVTAHYGS